MGSGAKAKHVFPRKGGRHYDQHANRRALNTLREEFQDSWIHLQSGREYARQFGREIAKCNQGLVERCEDLQKQRRAVENEMYENV